MFFYLEAHKLSLSVGLKNDVDQIHELEPYFDWALNEECVHYNECSKYKPFIDAHKVSNVNAFCTSFKTKVVVFKLLFSTLDIDLPIICKI